VFNLADSFIFVGAALLIGESLFSWRHGPDKMNER
jgi:lipoprotein signal peptidase